MTPGMTIEVLDLSAPSRAPSHAGAAPRSSAPSGGQAEAAPAASPRGAIYSIAFGRDEHGLPVPLRETRLDLDPDAGPVTAEAYLAAMAKVMDDCPECREARARGESPQWILGNGVTITQWPHELLAALPAPATNSHGRRRARERMRRMRRALRR